MTAASARPTVAEPLDSFAMPWWFEDQASWVADPAVAGNAIYNYPLALRLEGSLEAGALRHAVDRLLARHDVFRTVFESVPGGIHATVTPPSSVQWESMDAPQDGDTERQLMQTATEFSLQPFDLRRDHLLRALLVRVSENDHRLILVTHHLAYDDWSNDIAVQELAREYAAALESASANAGPIDFRYGDFTRWSAQRLRGNVLARHIDFWKKTLDHPTHFAHLQPDLDSAETADSHAGGLVSMSLDSSLAYSIQTLAHQTRGSAFMVLLAAFLCLLSRRSGQLDVGVASCSANRPRPEVEGLIGRFGNDLIIRTSLARNPAFRDLLVQLRNASLDAYSHQEVPFGRVMNAVAPPGHHAHKRLFQTMFILRSAPRRQAGVPGLKVTRIPVPLGIAKYDLNVWIDTDSGFTITFEYRARRFSRQYMAALLSDYLCVLQNATSAPDTTVSNL
jgi:hypothetical protein